MINRFPNNYSLFLSTGEQIEVSEFNDEIFPEIFNENEEEIEYFKQFCTLLNHQDVEHAKRGDDSHFKTKLRGDPISVHLKNTNPICKQKNYCAMYDSSRCHTDKINSVKKEKDRLPMCWEYGSENPLVNEIITLFFNAWRENRRVVLTIKS